MNHCSCRGTESTCEQSPDAVEPPPPPVSPPSSSLHAAATSVSASSPVAKSLTRLLLMIVPPSPGADRPNAVPQTDATSCTNPLTSADATRRGRPLERRGDQEERQAQQACSQDVRPGLGVVRQRDVAHDPAAE